MKRLPTSARTPAASRRTSARVLSLGLTPLLTWTGSPLLPVPARLQAVR